MLADMIGNGKINHVFLKSRLGDIHASISSILKAKRLINFHPQVDIENGLKQFAEWSAKESDNGLEQIDLIEDAKSIQ